MREENQIGGLWAMGSPATRRGLLTSPALEPDLSVQERSRFQQPLRKRRRMCIKKSDDQPPPVQPGFPREKKIRRADWRMRPPARRRGPWTPPAHLSMEERARFQPLSRQRRRIWIKEPDEKLPPGSEYYCPGFRSLGTNPGLIPVLHQAVDYYNARHPGGEFDFVEPLVQECRHYRGHVWWHFNFLARCRRSNKMKRFFAEVHYGSFVLDIPIVESCAMIEDRYRKSCGICLEDIGMLHPTGDRSFICGNNGHIPTPIGPGFLDNEMVWADILGPFNSQARDGVERRS